MQRISDDQIDVYLDYLEKEARQLYFLSGSRIPIQSIFIGGGTPNILSLSQIERLSGIIDTYFFLQDGWEFLMDWHPNFYTKEKLLLLKEVWVTRVTFAIQTLNSEVLRYHNRDNYDIHRLRESLKIARSVWLKVNVDLLVGLQNQTFFDVKNDIAFCTENMVDNVSVHYFVKSTNVWYIPDGKKEALIVSVKNYLKQKNGLQNSENIQEAMYTAQKSNLIWLWAQAVTHLFGKILYIKPSINQYYKQIDTWEYAYARWIQLAERDEMIKYIYLNILSWISLIDFESIFQKTMFHAFPTEISFLNENEVLEIRDNHLVSRKSDQETLTFFNIFLMKRYWIQPWNTYTQTDFSWFFLENGEFIDQ